MAKVRLRFISSFKVAKAKFLDVKEYLSTKVLKKSKTNLQRRELYKKTCALTFENLALRPFMVI